MNFFSNILNENLLKPFIFSMVISFAATYLLIPIAIRLKLVDNPKIRKHPANTHKGIIPRAGGISIFLGIVLPIIFFIPLTKQIMGILTASTLVVIVGVLDDKYDLSPYLRFATNLIAALIVVGSGIGVPYITNPFGGVLRLDSLSFCFDFFGKHCIIVWADILAVIWIVWCMNMINWSKGVDGQMPGFVAIASFVIGLLSLRFIESGDSNQWIPASLSFILAGAFLGFLPWNFYPQKIMPGYGGGSLAGFFLAVLAILSSAKVGTAVLVLGIPMLDAIYTIIRRIINGKSPFWGDRGHLHHKLLDAGWGRRKIALFYWLLSAILGIVALSVTSKIKFFTVLLIAVILGGFLLWLSIFSTFSKPSDQDNG